MRKKIIPIVLIILAIALGILAVFLIKNHDSRENLAGQNQLSENEKEDNPMETNPKTAVLYFSATGTTAQIAQKIASATGARAIEIVPKIKYTTDDLNYSDGNSRANREQNDSAARPGIEDVPGIDRYDIIYLGYPIWWGEAPKVISTLLDNYNFDGKTIIPFCTSGSSGIAQSVNTLKASHQNVNWLEGKRFDASASDSAIKEWIDGLALGDKTTTGKIRIKINGETFTATLENNSSASALTEKLKQGDITVAMHDYGNFEKVGELGFSLPRNDTDLTTTAGDIILYQGNQITIYYDTNTWNFTKLGHIDGATQAELKKILGSGDVTATFSLAQ